MQGKIFYIKIFGAIGISLTLSILISNLIFPSGSPRVRPHLISYVGSKLSYTLKNIMPKLNFNQNNPQQSSQKEIVSIKKALESIPLHTVAKGVYAKSNADYSYTLIKENEIDWTEVVMTQNGKIIKIRIPKGEKKPESLDLP